MDYFGFLVGAEGETRTPMKEPSLDPEPSVSTNSTTSAWKGGIPKTFRAGKRKNALSEEISAKTTLPSVFPPDFGSAPPRNWRRHPLSHGEDAGRADCPPQEYTSYDSNGLHKNFLEEDVVFKMVVLQGIFFDFSKFLVQFLSLIHI